MKTIGITLAAVVLMILVIGFFAMRFLRAEDNDEFEDLPQERIPSRPGGDRDYRDDDYRSQDYSAPSERAGGRNGRARSRRAAADAERQGRDYEDRSGRRRGSDYGRRPAAQGERGSRPAAERDGQRRAAAYEARRGSDGPQRRADSRPLAATAAARSDGRGQEGERASTDWDALSDVDYWAELASDKPLATTAQPARPAAASRGRRDRQASARPATDPRAVSQPGADHQLPGRTRSQPPAAAALPAAAGRPEYIPAPHSSYPYGGPASGPRPGDSGELGLGVLAGLGDQQGRGRPGPLPGDDDPLTSPSFPAVTSADSRSYRNPQPGTPPGGFPVQTPYGAPAQQLPAPGGAARREGYEPGGRQPAPPVSWPGGYGDAAGAAERTAPQHRQGYAPAAAYREHPGQLTQQPGSHPAETRSPRHGGGSSAGGPPAPAGGPHDRYASPPLSAYQAPASAADSSRTSGYDRSPAYPATGPPYQHAAARGTVPADYYPDARRGRPDPWQAGLPEPSRPGRSGERAPRPARTPGSYLDGGTSLPGPAADYGRSWPEPTADLPVRPAHAARPASPGRPATGYRGGQDDLPGYAAPDAAAGGDGYGYGGYPGYGGLR